MIVPVPKNCQSNEILTLSMTMLFYGIEIRVTMWQKGRDMRQEPRFINPAKTNHLTSYLTNNTNDIKNTMEVYTRSNSI